MEQITQIYKVDSSLDMEWSKQSIKDNYLLHGKNNLESLQELRLRQNGSLTRFCVWPSGPGSKSCG